MSRIWGAIVVLLVAIPWMASAQDTGKITGQVVNAETGEPLPGASVQVVGTQMGGATNQNGRFTIFEVPPGEYTLRATFVGFQTVNRTGVEIISGITRRVNFELAETAQELEEVTVQAQRPLVNPTSTSAVRRIGTEELQNLPTRDVSSYYALQPGVTQLNGQIYIRGGRPDETQYLLEGISSRSLMGADNVMPAIPEALNEVQVHAGGYSAEFGGANAGIVQQVLRTGGQEYDGMIQFETDRAASAIDDPGYGYDDLTVTLGGPIPGFQDQRFFLAVDNQNTDNYAPMFWEGADLGTPVDGITGDSAVSAIQWQDGELPGIRRPQEELRINGTLQFNLNPLRVRVGFAQLTRNRRINTLPIYNYFNQKRIPKRDDTRRLANVKATYFLGSNTYLEGTAGYFQYDFEIYDPLVGVPEHVEQGGRIPGIMDWYTRSEVESALSGEDAELYTQFWDGEYQPPQNYQFNAFRFARPGAMTVNDPLVESSYTLREQRYWDVGLKLTHQQDLHELRAGLNFRQWTVRNYRAGPGGLASIVQNDETYADSIAQEMPSVATNLRRGSWGGFGYDEFGNQVDSGPDGPKQPVKAAAFINDELEYNDIIVNAGLRLDYFDMDLWEVDDPRNPGFNRNTWQVDADAFSDAPAKTSLQPRLGFSFPVTEQTAFHLQYGKFAQMPDMTSLYRRRSFMATTLAGQFFIDQPFAWDLDPIESTQYEIGMQHQFTDFAAFDLTAFYRRTQGQIEIIRQETASNADAAPYNLFTNGDFSIARGLELSVRTRRIGNFRGFVNYTLTDAKGTNSDPAGQVAALEQGTAPPSMVQPLMFEERHRGSFMLDFSTGPEQPAWAQNWTANVLLTFHSGHRFTNSTGSIGQRGADEGPLLTDDDPRSREPTEPLNSSTTPWFFKTDLRVEKGFSIGPARATAFMYVENLLDRRNVVNVYLRTGDATSDGFFTNPSLSEQIIAQQGQEYVDYYQAINLDNRQHYINDWGRDLFATPRQVRVGLRLDF